MKQFDTVKNNEWVPTEEDLEGAIRVVDALPTASASEEGITYLLNGVMEGYTKTHFYKCVKETIEGVEQYVWRDLNVGRYSVGNCTNIRIMMFDDGTTYRVLFSWKDPEDVEVGSEHIYWKETRLVHQIGHMPVDVNDCVDSFTSTYRDQYSTFGSYSTTITADGRKHYFKLFPVSEDGAITNDDANGRVAGYNYVLTTDTNPLYDYSTGTPSKTYYFRSISPTTGEYVYTACAWDSNSFDGGGTDADPWRFKSGKIYYEYQNAFVNWAGIRDLIRNGEAKNYFPIKSILVLPYHGDFGEMSWEVVDYDTVQPADSSIEHTMTLQAKYLNRWWDYNGGVVFDTNEKGGARTSDTSRVANKTYFKRIRFNTGTNATTPAAIKAIGNVEGTPALYVETTCDETNRDYRNQPFSRNDMYECELPYVTRFVDTEVSRYTKYDQRNSSTSYLFAHYQPDQRPYYRSGTTTIGTVTYNNTDTALNVVLTKDTTFKYSKRYWKKTSATSGLTALTANSDYSKRSATVYCPGENIMDWINTYAKNNGVFESSSSAIGYTNGSSNPVPYGTYFSTDNVTIPAGTVTDPRGTVLSSNSVASNQNMNQAGYSKAEDYNDAAKQNYVLQPYIMEGMLSGWPRARHFWFGTPRSNGYAEYFWPVPSQYMEGSKIYYYTDLKYYVPTNATYTRGRNRPGNNKVTHYFNYNAYLCDVTEDLYTFYRKIADAALVLRAQPEYYKYTNNPENYKTDIGGWTLNMEEVFASALPIPTADDRWQGGKRYFRALYSAAETGGTAIEGVRYFTTSGSGTVIDPRVYKRVALPVGSIIPAGTYVVNYNELVEGTDYNVGDLIPRQWTDSDSKVCGWAMPFFELKRNAIRDAVEITDEESETFDSDPCTLYITSSCDKLSYTVLMVSSSHNVTHYIIGNTIKQWRDATGSTEKVYKLPNAYVWTLGNQNADGEYVACTQDYRQATPSCATGFTYSPSHHVADGYDSSKNICLIDTGIYEAAIGDEYVTVPEAINFTNNVVYRIRYKSTYQPFRVTNTTNSLSFALTEDTNFLADVIYFTKSGDEYTAADVTVGDTVVPDTYYVMTISVANNVSPFGWKKAVASTLQHVHGLDFLRKGGNNNMSDTIFYYGVKYHHNYVCNKTPNTERVAYGNHVWAQSNVRMYFNGPFDSNQEYQYTNDTTLKGAGSIYYTNKNAQYVKLEASTANTSLTYVVGTTVQAWENMTGQRVYNYFPGGTPVGYKLDINRPDKYNDYGLSPVMQYTFDNILNVWVPKYSAGCCWFSETTFNSDDGGEAGIVGEPIGRPSINNGLVYDRLATMYWSNCILQGELAGSDVVIRLSPKQDRTVSNSPEGGVYYGGYTSDSMKVLMGGAWKTLTGLNYGSTASRTVSFKEVLPRQSFLHGFLDCKYKRSNDMTYVSGKDYYLKNPYGGYDKLPEGDTFIQSGPYSHTLYELNGNYIDDLKDAKEFLDSIVPVVNRNGCYGTTGAMDFYPQTGSASPNLGGTVTVDKVWLASTSQVNGGTRANNGVYENPARSSYATVSGSSILQKYIDCGNSDRVKNGLTLGAHGTSGYADAMAGAQYWWLRSAGGIGYNKSYFFAIAMCYPEGYPSDTYGEVPAIPYLLAPDAQLWREAQNRLSPLITLG